MPFLLLEMSWRLGGGGLREHDIVHSHTIVTPYRPTMSPLCAGQSRSRYEPLINPRALYKYWLVESCLIKCRFHQFGIHTVRISTVCRRMYAPFGRLSSGNLKSTWMKDSAASIRTSSLAKVSRTRILTDLFVTTVPRTMYIGFSFPEGGVVTYKIHWITQTESILFLRWKIVSANLT